MRIPHIAQLQAPSPKLVNMFPHYRDEETKAPREKGGTV